MNHDYQTPSLMITLYALVTDRHIAAIKWLRKLASIDPMVGSHVHLGLKAAKEIADGLRDGEMIFSFRVDPLVADYVRDSAKLHGFVLTPPEMVRQTTLEQMVTLKPEYANDIPF